jgi:ankyrin repeat protein
MKFIYSFILLLNICTTSFSQISPTTVPDRKTIDEFYDAVFSDDTEKALKMLDTNFPATFEPSGKVFPLIAAIWQDNLTLVKALIDRGANFHDRFNSSNELTTSIIEEAASKGKLEISEYLLQLGCKVDNNAAFNSAAYGNYYQLAKVLLYSGANQELGDIRGKFMVFEEAINRSDYKVLKALKLSKEFINSRNEMGKTGLIIAIYNRNLNMVRFLLQAGADKNKPEMFDNGDDIIMRKKPIQIANKLKLTAIASLLK